MSEATTTPLARFGGRKFVVAVLTIACGMNARAFGWIDGAQLLECLKGALALYAAGNVGARAATAIAAAVATKQGSAQ